MKMSKYSTISGSLLANSHMFYLSRESKIFILKILTSTSDEVFILCSLSPSLQQKTREKCREILLNPPLIGQHLEFTNVKKVANLEKDPSIRKPPNIYQLTKQSIIKISDGVINPGTNISHETAPSNLGNIRY